MTNNCPPRPRLNGDRFFIGRIVSLIVFNIMIIWYLWGWVTLTNSVALNAYANTLIFNVLALMVCLISIWVSRSSSSSRPHCNVALLTLGHSEFQSSCCFPKPPATKSINVLNTNANRIEEGNVGAQPLSILGLEKYEVLALLISSCLAIVFEISILMEIVGRLGSQPKIHTGRLGLGALLGFFAHLGTILSHPEARLDHVVCTALPCPTLRGYNPIFGRNVISTILLCVTFVLVHYWGLEIADTLAALVVAGLTGAVMLPLAFFSANVIVQNVPHHLTAQLDKCLREALNIDGVLEFRNERFWAKSFGKLAGTLEVRIRRNADENYVLERVMKHLSTVVSSLSIREFYESHPFVIAEYPVEYYIDEILNCSE